MKVKRTNLDMLQMSPCTLTWWELPMIQSVRYSTSLLRNFISWRNVSSSRRFIICTPQHQQCGILFRLFWSGFFVFLIHPVPSSFHTFQHLQIIIIVIIIIIITISAFPSKTCSIVLNKRKYKSTKHMHIRHPNSMCPNNHAQTSN